MKLFWWGCRICLCLCLTVGVLVGTGCATRKADWAGRVGVYTYDQAVVELGPPDKQAQLTDGTLVAEWLTRRGANYLYAPPAPHPYYGGYYGSAYVDTGAPDFFLRLTFDSAGKLQDWKRLAR